VSRITAHDDEIGERSMRSETRDSLLRVISRVPIFAQVAFITVASSSDHATQFKQAQGIAWVLPAESRSGHHLHPPPRS
jgi:hypothetical protein